MKTKKSTSAISFETPTKQSYWGQPNETIRKSEPTTFPQSMIEELVHLKKTLIEITDPNLDPCVQNMHYYLAIKKRDLTHLEELLPTYGLMAPSTWNSSVAHALNTILQRISDSTGQRYGDDLPAVTIRDLVDRATNRKQFFQGKETSPSIMLTLPSTAAQDEKFIQQAVEAGVRFFRINSAHDTLEDRKAMAGYAKAQAKKQGKEVMVSVDLASRKMRTGKAVRILLPVVLAQKKQTVSVVLTSKKQAFTCVASSSHAVNHMATIAVSDIFLKMCTEGAVIEVTDMKGKIRELKVTQISYKKIVCTLSGKTIIDAESVLVIKHRDQMLQVHPKRIRPQPQEIFAGEGDEIYIGEDVEHSHAASKDAPVSLAITDPIALEGVKKGDHIYIDDGKIGLLVAKKHKKGVTTKVMYSKGKQVQILEEKGINFPDSVVALPALSDEDKEVLPEIAQFADMINISFVQSESDIDEVKEILHKAGKSDLPLVAKIETKEGVRNLPAIISALIAHGQGGVMIARGDLAVEAGFNRLARTQQDILDLCQSAYLPVIYATGVMETAMKNGLPARAEMIDLAASTRANCLMLNKGPYVLDTIRLIQDVYSSLKK